MTDLVVGSGMVFATQTHTPEGVPDEWRRTPEVEQAWWFRVARGLVGRSTGCGR